MISKDLTDFISRRLHIARRDLIEKDIILSKILFYLSQDRDFSQNYAFKGGTCLIKCYFGYFRFSEDLDFTYLNQKEFSEKSKKKMREIMSEKINKIGTLIGAIAKKLDLVFKIEKENEKYLQLGGSNALAAFKMWYASEELKKETFVKIQVSHIEKLKYPVKELNAECIVPKNLEKDFSFIVPEDADILLKPIKIKAYDLREILIEKTRAIVTRRGIKARDFIDVFLILKKERLNLNTLKKEIVEKIKDMLIFEKYNQNIKNKETQLSEEFVLGEEETLLLTPIDKDFPRFVKEFNIFLKETIKDLRL